MEQLSRHRVRLMQFLRQVQAMGTDTGPVS
jgi:hypothetical protein